MKCPYCRYLSTEHETLEGEINYRIGDISFCVNCGEIAQFVETGLAKIKFADLDNETKIEIKKIEGAWLQMRSLLTISSKENTK